MKKCFKNTLKLGMLIALLGSLALSGCGTEDAGSSNSNPGSSGQNASGQGTPGNSSASGSNPDKEAAVKSLDEYFEYTLVEGENTVLLTKYIGQAAQVTVYGSYKIGGKEYKTRLQDGVVDNTKASPFRNNTTVTSISFVDGVMLDNCVIYGQLQSFLFLLYQSGDCGSKRPGHRQLFRLQLHVRRMPLSAGGGPVQLQHG